jgi:hypothetical protein
LSGFACWLTPCLVAKTDDNPTRKCCIMIEVGDFPEHFLDREAVDTAIAQWHTRLARAIVEF